MAVDTKQWLVELGLGEYAEAFGANAIDRTLLPELTDADLKEMGVGPLGHRKRILRAAMDLAEDAAAPTAKTQPAAATGDAERRQLTVMFCDLVGSTALSERLDPEDLRAVMRRYQDAVAGTVTRFSGHVAKYLGDGVLAYFGWPQAHEDQAERAVRAGLDTVQAVAALTLDDRDPLAARVGIATGQVVVGDLVGEAGRDAEAVSGETPNLAARLQQVAEPGQVVVGSVTRRLVGGTFDMEDLGDHDLKGFSKPVPAWRVLGEAATGSRFEAAHGNLATRFIGRDSELALLLDRWRQTCSGEGQIVLLSGEAGIGKSRLMQALSQEIADQDHIRLGFQCAPYHTTSALYPVIRHLQHAAGFADDDDVDTRLAKLAEILSVQGSTNEDTKAQFAALLSLPHDSPAQTPRERKRPDLGGTDCAADSLGAGAAGAVPVRGCPLDRSHDSGTPRKNCAAAR